MAIDRFFRVVVCLLLPLQAMLQGASLYPFFATFLHVDLKGQLPGVQALVKGSHMLIWTGFVPKARSVYTFTGPSAHSPPLPLALASTGHDQARRSSAV